MKFFKPKKLESDTTKQVEQHKEQIAEAAHEAVIASEHLTDVLKTNGFTLKLYLTAGGRRKGSKHA